MSANHIQDLYLGGKKEEAIAAVPDELVRNVSLVGPRGYVKSGSLRYAEGGATTLLLQPLSGDRRESVRFFVEELPWRRQRGAGVSDADELTLNSPVLGGDFGEHRHDDAEREEAQRGQPRPHPEQRVRIVGVAEYPGRGQHRFDDRVHRSPRAHRIWHQDRRRARTRRSPRAYRSAPSPGSAGAVRESAVMTRRFR